MFGGPVRSWLYTSKLQRLCPSGVEARAVYLHWGKYVGLELSRRDRSEAVEVVRNILDRNPDAQIKRAAEFLLQRLDS